MRLLMIDAEARAKIARVEAHAKANPWTPDQGVPGDDERFIARLDTYRVVFTYTRSGGSLWRHLTISVPGPLFPNPAACFTIAHEFGFTGWDGQSIERIPKGWIGDVKEDEHCVMLAQEMTQ